MNFSKNTAKNKKAKIDTLIEELKKLDKEITENQNIKFKEKQMELENLMKEKTEGIILHSNVQWHEEGEKSTKSPGNDALTA
jgi:conjugal transfer/entry exclusion protein